MPDIEIHGLGSDHLRCNGVAHRIDEAIAGASYCADVSIIDARDHSTSDEPFLRLYYTREWQAEHGFDLIDRLVRARLSLGIEVLYIDRWIP